jgi:hypothetical protein
MVVKNQMITVYKCYIAFLDSIGDLLLDKGDEDKPA